MRAFRALTSVCLLISISGCAKPEAVVITEYRYQALPEAFLLDCPGTEWRGGTYRDLSKLAAARGADLDACNARLREARGFQAREAEKRGGTDKSAR